MVGKDLLYRWEVIQLLEILCVTLSTQLIIHSTTTVVWVGLLSAYFPSKNRSTDEIKTEHKCGTCNTNLSNARAKKTCFGFHEEFCIRYHKTVHFIGRLGIAIILFRIHD